MAAKSQTTSKTTTKKTSKTTSTKAKTTKTAKTAKTAKKVTKPASTIGKGLVIVESPAKARTVGQILGNKYVVVASQGHMRDLPKSKIGVNVEHDFEPTYVVMPDKRSWLNALKKAGDEAAAIYLATDPDREGEAISWHLQDATQWGQRSDPPKRVVFHEITKKAILEAFENPREIDMQLVNAQQARRILDRLVGYQISPLLWRRVQRGLSAGRVQSVAMRMVVDREREIGAFVPVESWTLEAQLQKASGKSANPSLFTAVLRATKGEKGRLTIPDRDEATRYESELKDAAYAVVEVKKRDVRQRPAAPFITSTLQQEAARKLRFTPQRTMVVAQQLYEGMQVGEGSSVGLITYMRTDSTQVADSAIEEAREYISDIYGKDYLPEKPREFRSKSKGAQEAHEAVRPTSIRRIPQSLKDHLATDQLRLYTLIWERMLASQMADARTEATTVEIEATCKSSNQVYLFRATGSVLRFPGFRTPYLESRDDEEEDRGRQRLPEVAKGDGLSCQKLEALQHFTQPPPRYSEATLIKALEEKGIGRPSTYAPTIATILDRHYVEKEQNRLLPTQLGNTVTDLLVEYFADIMDLDYTARMEERLDDVSRGEREWVPMLGEFYGPFQKALENAQESMPRQKVEEATDEICEQCGLPMVIKTGRFGRFIACTGFPDCKNTKRILNKTGVSCPKPDCGGDIVERRARGRRPFYGCSRYPDCDLLLNRKPVTIPCPECSGLMVEDGRDNAACTVCNWKQAIIEDPEESVVVGN